MMNLKLFYRRVVLRQEGFSLIELLLVVGLLTVLLGIVTINLLTSQGKASLSATIDVFISDMKQQQTKTMVGDNQGEGSAESYGIYFEANRYVLFKGTIYVNGAASNIEVPLEDNIQFSTINFPNNSLVFVIGSGEISEFNDLTSSAIISNTANEESKTILFNKYGVITAVN